MYDQPIPDRPFKKSTFSSPDGGCVEVGASDGLIRVRDSKDRSGPMLTFNAHEWDAFLKGARAGEFDLVE